MADLTVTELSLSDVNGTTITASAAAAASGGDEFVNDGRTILLITSTDSGTPTITVSAQRDVSVPGYGYLDGVNHAVTLGAGNVTKVYQLLGPFAPAIYNDGDGRAQITYSAVTNLSVQAIRLPAV